MSENTEFVPELTLTPEGFPSFEEALAATEAPAAAAAAVAPTAEEDNAVIKESIETQMSSLTEEERKQVEAFSKQIDITDTNTVLTYGAASQKHISDFSDTALNAVRTKDLGEVGDMLSDLVVELKGFNFDEKQKKGLFGMKKKAQQKIEEELTLDDL